MVIFIVLMSLDIILFVVGVVFVVIVFCVGFFRKVNLRIWNWIFLIFNLVVIIGSVVMIG